jgi:hypothetical protein
LISEVNPRASGVFVHVSIVTVGSGLLKSEVQYACEFFAEFVFHDISDSLHSCHYCGILLRWNSPIARRHSNAIDVDVPASVSAGIVDVPPNDDIASLRRQLFWTFSFRGYQVEVSVVKSLDRNVAMTLPLQLPIEF